MHRQRRHRRQRGGDGPRLERQQEIERDAAAEHHRQPEKPALLLGFEVASEEPQERQLPRRRTWRQPGDVQGPRLDSAHLRHRTHPAAAPAARGRRYSGARPAYGAHRRQAPSLSQVSARPWPSSSCAGCDAHPDHLRLEIAAALTYVGNGMEAHTRRRRAELGGRVDSREAWAIAIATLLMPSISFGATLHRDRCAEADRGRSRRLPLDPRGGGFAGHDRHRRRRPRHGVARRSHRRQADGDRRCPHDMRRSRPRIGRSGLAALRWARASRRVARQRRHQRPALRLYHPLVRASPRHRAGPDRQRPVRGRRHVAIPVRARDRRLRLAADHDGLRRAGGAPDRADRRPGPEPAPSTPDIKSTSGSARTARQGARPAAQWRVCPARGRVLPVLRADGHAERAHHRAVRRSRHRGDDRRAHAVGAADVRLHQSSVLGLAVGSHRRPHDPAVRVAGSGARRSSPSSSRRTRPGCTRSLPPSVSASAG